jgi:hypothetical protein
LALTQVKMNILTLRGVGWADASGMELQNNGQYV